MGYLGGFGLFERRSETPEAINRKKAYPLGLNRFIRRNA
jgi:hypothetical protein